MSLVSPDFIFLHIFTQNRWKVEIDQFKFVPCEDTTGHFVHYKQQISAWRTVRLKSGSKPETNLTAWGGVSTKLHIRVLTVISPDYFCLLWCVSQWTTANLALAHLQQCTVLYLSLFTCIWCVFRRQTHSNLVVLAKWVANLTFHV